MDKVLLLWRMIYVYWCLIYFGREIWCILMRCALLRKWLQTGIDTNLFFFLDPCSYSPGSWFWGSPQHMLSRLCLPISSGAIDYVQNKDLEGLSPLQAENFFDTVCRISVTEPIRTTYSAFGNIYTFLPAFVVRTAYMQHHATLYLTLVVTYCL